MDPDHPLQDQIRRFQQQLEANPDSLVFARLADLHRKAGEPDRGLEVLRGGLERHPQYASGHIVRGRCLRDLDDGDGARQAFERVLELDNQNLVALRALAELARERGDRQEAERRLQALLQVDPHNEPAREMLDDLTGSDTGLDTGAPAGGTGDDATGVEDAPTAVEDDPTGRDEPGETAPPAPETEDGPPIHADDGERQGAEPETRPGSAVPGEGEESLPEPPEDEMAFGSVDLPDPGVERERGGVDDDGGEPAAEPAGEDLRPDGRDAAPDAAEDRGEATEEELPLEGDAGAEPRGDAVAPEADPEPDAPASELAAEPSEPASEANGQPAEADGESSWWQSFFPGSGTEAEADDRTDAEPSLAAETPADGPGDVSGAGDETGEEGEAAEEAGPTADDGTPETAAGLEEPGAGAEASGDGGEPEEPSPEAGPSADAGEPEDDWEDILAAGESAAPEEAPADPDDAGEEVAAGDPDGAEPSSSPAFGAADADELRARIQELGRDVAGETGDPDEDLATETLAGLYEAQGFHRQAVEMYEELVEQRPDDPELRRRLERAREALEVVEEEEGVPSGPSGSGERAGAMREDVEAAAGADVEVAGQEAGSPTTARGQLRALLRGEARPDDGEGEDGPGERG